MKDTCSLPIGCKSGASASFVLFLWGEGCCPARHPGAAAALTQDRGFWTLRSNPTQPSVCLPGELGTDAEGASACYF